VKYSLTILQPGHPDGYAGLWCWNIRSLNDIEVGGTSPNRSEALAHAAEALRMVMKEEK
jgi:hypothetical protein